MKPILVTGSHRSGSTWVGKMLALPRDVGYIHEPFNLHHRPGICTATFERKFRPYICRENESLCADSLEATLKFKYAVGAELKVLRSVKDILRFFRDFGRFTDARLASKRPLVKDPIAVFSAEWLAQKFAMDVVVLIRHPAAFAGSIKRANWIHHPFSHYLDQPLLMRDHLGEYRSTLEEYAETKKGAVDQAILLWNMIHHMILGYRDNHPDWIFVRHEDLSRQPVQEFRKLYDRLGLDFTSAVQTRIERFSSDGSNPRIHTIKRDSRSNIFEWKARLTAEEIAKVKEQTHAIAMRFYNDKDWGE